MHIKMESVCNKLGCTSVRKEGIAVTTADTGDLVFDQHGHDPFDRHPPAPVPPKATLDAAGEILRALAAPVRIAIVLQLRESGRCVHELVEAVGVTQPLVSQHLRILKAAGVVRGERNGREVLYELVDDHLAHIVVDAVAHAEEG